MSCKIAINGCGRVGQALLRAYCERKQSAITDSAMNQISIAAINEKMPADLLHHLISFDSTYGALPSPIECAQRDSMLYFADQSIEVLNSENSEWPWRDLGIDLVIESSGQLKKITDLREHIYAGAKQVILTAPLLDSQGRLLNPSCTPDAGQIIPTLPWPQETLRSPILTTHSCTTQALVTLLYPLIGELSIDNVFATEIHGYTSDQNLLDGNHDDWRRARSATQSIIPTPTQGIESASFILPELENKIQGYSLRVPTPNVACLELTLLLQDSISKNSLLGIYQAAIETKQVKHLHLNSQPLVSKDFMKHPGSAIIDTTFLQAQGRQVKLLAWYDNEWGYTCRVLDLITEIANSA